MFPIQHLDDFNLILHVGSKAESLNALSVRADCNDMDRIIETISQSPDDLILFINSRDTPQK